MYESTHIIFLPKEMKKHNSLSANVPKIKRKAKFEKLELIQRLLWNSWIIVLERFVFVLFLLTKKKAYASF